MNVQQRSTSILTLLNLDLIRKFQQPPPKLPSWLDVRTEDIVAGLTLIAQIKVSIQVESSPHVASEFDLFDSISQNGFASSTVDAPVVHGVSYTQDITQS